MNVHSISKILLDFVISSVCLIIFAPFFVIYACYVVIFKNINPIIIQTRGVGLNNKKIKVIKIRTMKSKTQVYNESKSSLKKMYLLNPLLPMGAFLRRTGLDELPQLLLVLIGKMSLIGPRPLLIEDLKRLDEFNPNFTDARNKINCKPGISGLWQLERTDELSFDELISLDIAYAKNKGLKMELDLILRTTIKVIRSKHSDNLYTNSKFSPVVKNKIGGNCIEFTA